METRHGAEGLRDLDHFIGRAGIELIAVDPGTRQNGPYCVQPFRQRLLLKRFRAGCDLCSGYEPGWHV